MQSESSASEEPSAEDKKDEAAAEVTSVLVHFKFEHVPLHVDVDAGRCRHELAGVFDSQGCDVVSQIASLLKLR